MRKDVIDEKIKSFEDIHPRLLFDKQRIEQLEKPELDAQRKIIIDNAYVLVSQTPPEYLFVEGKNDELWQRDVGDSIALLAFAAMLTKDSCIYKGALKWAKASCSYPNWGKHHPDLCHGHQLFGLAAFYDWCYDMHSPETKKMLENTLLKRGREVYEAKDYAFWRTWSLQNHMWIPICGVLSAAVVLFDKNEECVDWIKHSIEKFDETAEALSDDGDTFEGVMYWVYGLTFLLRAFDIIRSITSVDFYKSCEKWLSNTILFKLFMTLPEKSRTASKNIFDICDADRADSDSPCSILKKLAHEYKNPIGLYLADSLNETGTAPDRCSWQTYIWHYDDLEPRLPDLLETTRHFEDMDILVSKSDWSGDESVLLFKCGPAMGHKAFDVCHLPPYPERGAGHAHPDANHISLYHDGEFLLRDDGYTFKLTASHNSLLINNIGQLGGGGEWFDGYEALKWQSTASIVHKNVTDEYVYVVGDATDSYPIELSLKKFLRHILYIKPNILLVIDDVETEEKRDFETRFFTELSGCMKVNGGYVLAGKNNLMSVNCLAADGGEFNYSMCDVYGGLNKNIVKRPLLSLKKNGTTLRSVISFSWSKTDEMPPFIKVQKNENVYSIFAEDSYYNLDICNRKITINKSLKNKESSEDLRIKGIFVEGKTILWEDGKDEMTYTWTDAISTDMESKPILSPIPCDLMNEISVDENIITVKSLNDEKKYKFNFIRNIPQVNKIDVVNVCSDVETPTNPSINVIDKTDNFWTSLGDGHWVKLDTGALNTVSGVQVRWYKGDARKANFEIEASKDGNEWDKLYNGESSMKQNFSEFYAFKHTECRFIRIICHGNNLNMWNSIVSIEIFKEV